MNILEVIGTNKKFVSKIDKGLLKELTEKGQKPVAAIISCSDSRVPVEVILNQLRPGTFFVIRVAGNVVSDSSVKGSIEYAVTHLKVPYLIVLGHTECGLVKAYLDGINKGEIGRLLSNMTLTNKELGKAVIENVEIQVKRVSEIGCVKEALDKGIVEVYGMLYELRTGKVRCLNKSDLPP